MFLSDLQQQFWSFELASYLDSLGESDGGKGGTKMGLQLEIQTELAPIAHHLETAKTMFMTQICLGWRLDVRYDLHCATATNNHCQVQLPWNLRHEMVAFLRQDKQSFYVDSWLHWVSESTGKARHDLQPSPSTLVTVPVRFNVESKLNRVIVAKGV